MTAVCLHCVSWTWTTYLESGTIVINEKKVKKLMVCYDWTCDQFTMTESFISEFVAYQEGKSFLSRESFFSFLSALGSQYRHFALQHKEFTSLPKIDQRRLLARNTPIYVQYILGRYITAEDGYTQLLWILGSINTVSYTHLTLPTIYSV